MAVYVGEELRVAITATDPVTEQPIIDADAEIEFFTPGKKPKTNPADRTVDQGPYPLTFDASLGAYVGSVSTNDWLPGRWSYRAVLTGTYESWEYGSVSIKA